MSPTKYVTIYGLAEYLSVSPSTIRGWVRTGIIEPEDILRVGRTYRFNLERIESKLVNESPAKPADDNQPQHNE